MFYAEKLLNHSSFDISSNSQIGAQFKHLHVSLNIILNFGDALLQDLLAMYRTVENLVFFGGKVMIVPPSKEDLQNIIKAWYPNLEPISKKLIETFERVNSSPVHQLVGFHPRNSAVSYLSRFSLRDLLKWCK